VGHAFGDRIIAAVSTVAALAVAGLVWARLFGLV
jgi:hypothetical protein